MIKAIETTYKGYRFRSRLEARWAVFFDALGVKWQYEPEGFELADGTRYLPDFHLGKYTHGGHSYGPWVEVKGSAPTEGEIKKMGDLCESLCAYGLIVWGLPNEEQWLHFHKEMGLDDGSANTEFDMTGGSLADMLQLHGHGPYKYVKYDITQASQAAKSARFEFGQSGARA